MITRTFSFNNEELYGEYSELCQSLGLSMSHRIERFIEKDFELVKEIGKQLQK